MGLVIRFSFLFLVATATFAAPIHTVYTQPDRFARSPSNPVINYYIGTDATSLAAEIRQSFQVWDNVSTIYLQLTEVAQESQADVKVTFGSRLNTEEFIINRNSSGERTSVWWKLNSNILEQSGNTRLSTLIHEAGHALGLGHSLETGAVMSYRRGSNIQLTVDDKYAITLLYPVDGNLAMPMGCASISNINNTKQGFKSFMIEFLFLSLFMGTFIKGYKITVFSQSQKR
ncbi:MAG: matrixin family metalloprotease [Oligoflexia bacterium]|nr:matrixin family metalloprotease [Oligoflexia bacterium]